MQDSDNHLPMDFCNGVIISLTEEALSVEAFKEYEIPLIHVKHQRNLMITQGFFSGLLFKSATPKLQEWEEDWVTENKASKLEKEQRGKRKHDPRLHVESLASREQLKKERIQALLSKRKTRS